MYKVLISILFLLLAFPSLAKVRNKDYLKPIVVRSSAPKFVIRLPSNRTTGFSWFLLSNHKELLEPVSVRYQPPKKTMPGAPGFSVWTFKVDDDAFDVPHILYVTMIYARPWDLKSASKKIITVFTRQEK